MGLTNNEGISETNDFLSIRFVEEKMFIFEHIIVMRDEPARPGPAVALFDALFLS